MPIPLQLSEYDVFHAEFLSQTRSPAHREYTSRNQRKLQATQCDTSCANYYIIYTASGQAENSRKTERWSIMSINQRIKQVRQTVGLPQTKFAERIAISISYIAEIELGKKNVNNRIIRLISAEFGVDEHWLKTGEGSMFDDQADTKAIKATSLFKLLNPRFQEFALNQLNDLVGLCNSPDK